VHPRRRACCSGKAVMTGALEKRPGGNFTQPAVDLISHSVRYLVFVHWRRQPREYESAVEAEHALHSLLEREREPKPEPDLWIDGQMELWK
jgi:hypothetical protein